jgi:hypothetical protein
MHGVPGAGEIHVDDVVPGPPLPARVAERWRCWPRRCRDARTLGHTRLRPPASCVHLARRPARRSSWIPPPRPVIWCPRAPRPRAWDSPPSGSAVRYPHRRCARPPRPGVHRRPDRDRAPRPSRGLPGRSDRSSTRLRCNGAPHLIAPLASPATYAGRRVPRTSAGFSLLSKRSAARSRQTAFPHWG